VAKKMSGSAQAAAITSISKMRCISDFKTFSESCPFMVRDQTNMKNCIFKEDFPTDCRPEVCPFVIDVPLVPHLREVL